MNDLNNFININNNNYNEYIFYLEENYNFSIINNEVFFAPKLLTANFIK